MAKSFRPSQNPNTPSPTYQIPSEEFSPAWVEANKEKLEAAGFEVVSRDEFKKKVHKETEAEQAAKEVLGLDVDQRRETAQGYANSHELWDFLTKLKIQLDLILDSTQFRGLMSPKEREAIHGARVLLRQIFGEKAPIGQASTLRELISTGAQTSDGVLGDTVRKPPKKPIKLDHRHLRAAGVIPDE